jgi:hypothetical protein
MFMLVMVLDDSTRLNEVLEAWIESGVKGVTILESTGVNRVLPRDSASLAVIDDLEIADVAVKGTERVLGDLTKPHTGIIFALPVVKTWGLPEPYAPSE